MGYIRFRRRFPVAPGTYGNVGKGSASASIGGRGRWVASGSRGRRATVSLPGTGLWHAPRSHPRRAALAKARGGSADGLGRLGLLFLGHAVACNLLPR